MNPFSRRSFLKGIGTTALVGAASHLSKVSAAGAAAEAETFGPGEVDVSLKINGQTRALRVEPRVTLLDALRNRLDCTGPKEVCDRGNCGACTVMLDGKSMYSCMVLAVEAQGKAITTVEGLAKGGKHDVVQKAFIENDGLMCGFCTPGFVTSARALLDKTPSPTREQIVKACSGNLCRCGAYAHIVQAIEKAAKGEVAA